MKPELDKQLTQTFPEIFQPTFMKNHREHPLEYFGFECGNGWYKIIYDLCTELMSVPAPAPLAAQVKEKYGTLRFYVDQAVDAHHNIIDHYEHMSSKTCEVCGEPGQRRMGGWIRTLCETHNQLKHNQ